MLRTARQTVKTHAKSYNTTKYTQKKNTMNYRYVKFWFWIDLFSCLPVEIILAHKDDLNIDDTSKNQNDIIITVLEILLILRLVVFFRLIRVINIFTNYQVSTKRLTRVGFKLFQLVGIVLLILHNIACFWYYIGKHEYNDGNNSWIDESGADITDNTTSTFSKYVVSAYFTVITICTVGYGDIAPSNENEQITAVACILIGIGLFTYFIGEILSIIIENNRIRNEKQAILEQTQTFCEFKQLPTDLSRAVMAHSNYYFYNNYQFNNEQIINPLPKYLRYFIIFNFFFFCFSFFCCSFFSCFCFRTVLIYFFLFGGC